MTCLNPTRTCASLAVVLCLVVTILIPSKASAQVKYVYSLDYPLAQKASYLEWVRSIAPILQAPEEIRAIVSYDNVFGVSPHRYIEFEFDDMKQAGAYFEQPEINEVLEHVVNYGINGGLAVLERRGDYDPQDVGRGAIKYVFGLDYPLGRKDDYLEWVKSIAASLEAPEEIIRISSFDNSFGVSPHRYIEFEFADLESAGRYFQHPEVAKVFEDVVSHGVNGRATILKLRSDYVTE